MFFIKYSGNKEKLMELMQTDPRFKNMERKAARVIEIVTGVQVDVENEDKTVDMCQALREMMEDANKEGMQLGMQQGTQKMVRKLLEEGSLSIEVIAQMADLSVEEVQALAIDAM